MKELDARRILNLPEGFSAKDLKTAWYYLRSKHHPDRGGDAGTFSQVNQAYEFLLRHLRCPACDGTKKQRVQRGFAFSYVDCAECGGTGRPV